ncbi:transcriptional regulator, Sir2 family [Necator americanus]|uniref:NAD-dependent protein deacetylase sir-2.1 n=1 Tax=Necator americanus TaxID=51031 RepID=W2TEV4_NECAM|nr:transcriptional regulator, Sir2 family [Necator americanus]ETN80590.1 transcriptional regulator, Sir2 family [Necator americanus]
MVNATSENGCCDSTSEISTLTPEDSRKNVCDAFLKVEAMLSEGASLIDVLKTLYPGIEEPPEGWSDHLIMSILAEIIDRPPRREKLPEFNTFEDAVELFRTRKRILILTGAGVSVSCGIPDFRSKDGIYARLHVDFPDLPDPTAMFDIRYFTHNPAPFYDFAMEIFPGQYEPSISHKFIRQLEINNQLLRNYTQNIDTLEKQTQIEKVVECHGSFSKATCLNCSAKFDGDVIREDVMAKRVARCPRCTVGVMKPDIVFFGEDLGRDFHSQMALDKDEVDLLVVIGSSLKVRPVSLIPFSVNPNVPQILINREPLSGYKADIELLGNCDDIIEDICLALGGSFVEMLEKHQKKMKERSSATSNGHIESEQVTVSVSEVVRRRRRTAKKEEFLQIMKQLEISGHSECNSDFDGISAVKRPRLEDMYERRYIPVAKHLPEHTYFQISANRAVFPGAELYYDLETGAICQPTSYRPDGGAHFGIDSGDDDDDNLDEDGQSCTGMVSRACSMPDTSGAVDAVDMGPRAASCEPSVDLDAIISAREFHLQLDGESSTKDEEEEDDDL